MRARVLALVLTLVLFGCTKKDPSASPPPANPALATQAVAMMPTGVDASAAPAPAPPAQPRLVGRWVKDGNGMRCAWSGCYVTARFVGTGISARLRDDGANLLEVVVDGETKKVLKLDRTKGESSYPLVDGLPDGPHEVEIHKRTEAKVGDVVFVAFEPKDGRLVPPPPAPEHRIELLGDSITAGYGNEGPNATCTYVNTEQNEYATYGAIAARSLAADHTTVAWSGKTQYEMRQYFDKALPASPAVSRPEAKWDFTQYQPHVVVLNLGTNDFANVDPGESRFVRQYLELMRDVRAAYPRAFVVIALGPMLTDAYPPGRQNLTKARKYVKAVVRKLRENGETNFDFLEFPEQNHADGLGCGFHPGLKTHKLMADRLTAFIKERVGW